MYVVRGLDFLELTPEEPPCTGSSAPGALKLPAEEPKGNARIKSITPRPPRKPRLERAASLDEKSWRRWRRLKTSQESLTDANETSSSNGSLQDAPLGPAAGARAAPSEQSSSPDASDASPAGKSRGNAADLGKRVSELSSSFGELLRGRALAGSKPRLSRIAPGRPLPPVELNVASHALRTTNRIDADCLDYRRQRQRGLGRVSSSSSDSRLHGSAMGCDSCSTDSMKSTVSLLAPIRAKDVRS
ncbi:PREDICTED: 72 kDa inositol polyphosphate 5-phosphatase-like, partial [Tinamus guttatus]|uniref:72 kDa inositol polyphosphate 5-phosphatase-like n=1 Tax=Tinamus guttatus TaxID=94827 RepID=UPI00052E8D5A